MAGRPAGVLRLGKRAFGTAELAVMGIAGDMDRVHVAVAQGADLIEIFDAAGPFVAAVRAAYPELVIGVRTGRREVAWEAGAAGADLLVSSEVWAGEVAGSFGMGVAGPVDGVAPALAAGVEAERVLVEGRGAVGSGWPVLASSGYGEEAGQLAALAVAGWLGARVFRVEGVRAARRALRMVSAIRGDIPPARAVRGLGLRCGRGQNG